MGNGVSFDGIHSYILIQVRPFFLGGGDGDKKERDIYNLESFLMRYVFLLDTDMNILYF